MSFIFFDQQLSLSDPRQATVIAWSKVEDVPLLAVAEAESVRIFREEGEELPDYKQTGRCQCTALTWHPRGRVLAAGWEDGSITFQGPGSVKKDDREVHQRARIRCIAFNPMGTRMVTCDANGLVVVWKTDHKGLLKQECNYRKQGSHDKVIFRTMTPSGQPKMDNPEFFFAGDSGIVYLADDMSCCSEKNKIGSPVHLLEYLHERDQVVVVTDKALLVMFSLDNEGKVSNETQMKLSCGPDPRLLQGVWAGAGLLAMTSNESMVRMFNLVDDESYLIALQGIDDVNSLAGDKATSIDFNPRKRVLAVGTKEGRVVQWRCSTLEGTPKSEENWQVLPIVSAADCAIDRIRWGPGENLIHCRTERSQVVLTEAQLNTAVQRPYIAVQTSPTQVLLHHLERSGHATIKLGLSARCMALGGNYVLVWNSKQASVHEIDEHNFTVSDYSSFSRENSPIAAAVLITHDMEVHIGIASGARLEIANLYGNVIRSVQFSHEVEGFPVSLSVSGSGKGVFLAASTTKSVLRMWNMTRTQEKPIGNLRKFEGVGGRSLGEIRSVRVNSDGTRVSLLVDQLVKQSGVTQGVIRVPDTRIFVYDVETDAFLSYKIGTSRVPMSHMWDTKDARLMACEVVSQLLAYDAEEAQQDVAPTSLESLRKTDEEPPHSVKTLFVAGSERILLQDTLTCSDTATAGVHDTSHKALRMPVALVVPHMYFARQQMLGGSAAQTPAVADAASGQDGAFIIRQVLRDFAGLEHVNPETTSALLNFSYHLACGDTDLAYKSVEGVKSKSVWESMSKMCVKTGRLDVAQKCLGQMGHARAASALRACKEPEDDAKLAAIAVHLDMFDDAVKRLEKCGRYDILNLYYQANGEWDKALEIAKTKDRIHLKPTHFAYAQHLEAVENVQEALSHFELSGTYRTESPRLLCSLGLTDELESYIDRSQDEQLHRWYAQYLESKANLDGAAREYKKARDWLSLCRVACFNRDLDTAQKICEDHQDPAACYHLARHLEAEGRVKDAIHFFQMAGRLSHALRLAQENNMDGDLMSLALSSDPANMAQAARHYEQRGQHSKAVVLYQKAGWQKRALELCFSAKLFDSLRKVAEDLSADSDPEILARCAQFFMEHKQHDKAVHLLSMSHQYERAVELCYEHSVQVTEEMAERMTPEKNSMDAAARSEILARVAQLCKKQGSFQLACKKYTQAGDKLKAMKCLLQSGDTEKIIFFAGTARQPDIYVLAGNYLQSLQWHNDPDIMKNIIQFYSKAKAYEKLSTFYDACAQVEIDEYRDYDKATGALQESLKYLAKSIGSGAENDHKVHALQSRIELVTKFAGVRKLAKSNPEEMVQVCLEMVEMPDIDPTVRIGDIFAQLVEHYHDTQNFQEAYRCVEQMRQRNIVLTPYVDQAQLVSIYGAVGQPPPRQEAGGAPGAAPPGADDDVGEEIEEDN